MTKNRESSQILRQQDFKWGFTHPPTNNEQLTELEQNLKQNTRINQIHSCGRCKRHFHLCSPCVPRLYRSNTAARSPWTWSSSPGTQCSIGPHLHQMSPVSSASCWVCLTLQPQPLLMEPVQGDMAYIQGLCHFPE